MSYSPFPVESFGGLTFEDPGSAGWSSAIDIYNVEVEHGRVRSRGGYSLLGTAAANVDSAHMAITTGTDYLIVGTTTPTLQVMSTTGVVQTVNRIGGGTGTTQTASANPHNFVSFGDSNEEYVYIANGADINGVTNQIRRFKPSTLTFSEPAGLAAYTGNLVGVTPWDNRLVTNDATHKSRIWFSDAGAPETIGANNWIEVTPGDGERIVAIKAWRDLLFVFKQSKFYVFYGTSTDSSGNPIFNYRTVDAGIGIDCTDHTYAQRAVTVAPDALYFMSYKGLFRTTGGVPEEMSSAVRPLFYDGNLGPFFALTAVVPLDLAPDNVSKVFLQYSDGRFYFGVGGLFMLVFDPANGTWSVFSLPSNTFSATSAIVSGLDYLILCAGTSVLYYIRGGGGVGVNTDNGTAITSRYRTGFSDLGTPDKKRIREWLLQGSGSPTFQTSVDFGSLETGSAVTLGTSRAVSENRRRYAVRGRQVSFQIGGTSAWSVNNVIAHVADKKLPGET